MLEKLDTLAAMTLRDAVENSIAHLEKEVAKKEMEGLRVEADAYFRKLHKEQLAAIEQLKRVRREVHGRVFESMQQS